MDVEGHFEHDLKTRKRRKCRSNLSLNQSHKKKKKFNYGKEIRLRNIPDEGDNAGGESSCNLHFSVAGENIESNLAAPTGQDISFTQSSSESIDVISQASHGSDVSPYVHDCINKCKNIFLEDVIKNFDKEGLLLHFMAFMEMIASGQLSVVNMAVLLAMEMALLFTLTSTTQMQYRKDTSLFWETILAVGGPRMLHLFSSDKHFGQVNSGESAKSKYPPSKGHFNFTVPDEKTLLKSKLVMPKFIPCGIIEESVKLLDKEKEFVLSLDGKQLIPSLLNESEGDVNLWGYEGPPSLKENLEHLDRHQDIILDVVSKVSIDDNAIDAYCADLKLIVQITTKRIHDLRQAKVRQEQL